MARARPSAVLRFSAKIDTSVAKVTRRNTDIEPTTASAPSAIGSAAVSSPPNTHTSTRKLKGIAIISMTSRSAWFCLLIWAYSMAAPPAWTVTPPRSWMIRSERVCAFFCTSFSPPLRLTTISPVLPSLLIRSVAAAGGTVHGEVAL